MICMSKKSRLNVEPSLEDIDSWWDKMDDSTKKWIHAIAKNKVSAGKPDDEVKKLSDYSGKRIQFLKELPKVLIDHWEVGATTMHYVTHTKDMVIYNIVHQIAEDEDDPNLDESREILDSKVVAFFYTHTGKGKIRPYPVARRTSVSTRLHRKCGTNPALRHLVIEDRTDKNYIDDGCWCNQFLWSLGFPVTEKF